jgi:hypothetical protein
MSTVKTRIKSIPTNEMSTVKTRIKSMPLNERLTVKRRIPSMPTDVPKGKNNTKQVEKNSSNMAKAILKHWYPIYLVIQRSTN